MATGRSLDFAAEIKNMGGVPLSKLNNRVGFEFWFYHGLCDFGYVTELVYKFGK